MSVDSTELDQFDSRTGTEPNRIVLKFNAVVLEHCKQFGYNKEKNCTYLIYKLSLGDIYCYTIPVFCTNSVF